MKKKSFLRRRLDSFKYAFKGIYILVTTQTNARIHLLISLLIIVLGFMFHLNGLEWLFIILAMALVWVAEALNTAIEFVIDLITEDHHHLAEKAKDVGAAAVLIAAVFATIVGLIIFIPKII